jgi:c-di-GMP-binding flagellar brake protein YcgR
MSSAPDSVSLRMPAVERRRSPRVTPPDDVKLCMPVVVNAEVLDISAGGALVSTSAALHVTQRAQLRLLLDKEPFSGWIEVLRLEAGTEVGAEHRHRLGVAFTSLDDKSRRALVRFVKDDARPT